MPLGKTSTTPAGAKTTGRKEDTPPEVTKLCQWHTGETMELIGAATSGASLVVDSVDLALDVSSLVP